MKMGQYPLPATLSSSVSRVRRASRRHSPAAHPATVEHPLHTAHPARLDRQSQDGQPIVPGRPDRPNRRSCPNKTIIGADERGHQDRTASLAKEGGYPMPNHRSLLLAGLAALCSAGAIAAEPPPAPNGPAYQIVLRSRVAE